MDRPAMNIIEDDLERMNGPLQVYMPFNGNLTDSAQYQKVSNSGSMVYVEGVNKEAFQGNGDAVIQLPLTDKIVDLSSFTVAFWLNADKASSKPQTVFAIGNSADFWGNIFALIEPNTNNADPTMLLKLNFAGNWVRIQWQSWYTTLA